MSVAAENGVPRVGLDVTVLTGRNGLIGGAEGGNSGRVQCADGVRRVDRLVLLGDERRDEQPDGDQHRGDAGGECDPKPPTAVRARGVNTWAAGPVDGVAKRPLRRRDQFSARGGHHLGPRDGQDVVGCCRGSSVCRPRVLRRVRRHSTGGWSRRDQSWVLPVFSPDLLVGPITGLVGASCRRTRCSLDRTVPTGMSSAWATVLSSPAHAVSSNTSRSSWFNAAMPAANRPILAWAST